MNLRDALLAGLPRVLSTAIASSVFAAVALVMLATGLRGTGFGGQVVSALWPGMAAITALLLAVVMVALHAVLLAVRMPAEMRAALAAVSAAGPVSPERPIRAWEQARFRTKMIGGFGLPLGLLLLGVGFAAGDERMLWIGSVGSLVGLALLVLSAWISRRVRRWLADVERVRLRKSYAAGQRVHLWREPEPYQPFEQLSEMLHAAPARVVTLLVAVGFAALMLLMLFNLAVLGNEAGYAPADLGSNRPPTDQSSAAVGWILLIAAVAFAMALAVAVVDVVRSAARGGEADPRELLSHPFAAFGAAGIAVGFAFLLVWPGQVPVGSAEIHLEIMRGWWWVGAVGVGSLLIAAVLSVTGAAPSIERSRRPA